MLFRLTIITFIFSIQCISEEGFTPPETMTQAIEQAKKLQQDTTKFLDKNPGHNILNGHQTKKCCSFKGPTGKHPNGKLSREDINANKGCKNHIASLSSQQDKAQIMVFVSFSMPESSLKSLFQEVSQHNAVLVMHGLYQDSFVKTAQKLQNLGVTVDINPELFETHRISAVPTFVQVKNNHPIQNLKGNVTLEFVARKFEDLPLEEVQ
jgi:conjugal transfer pilus assembly protein TrbC